ncbi:MAG TPA: chromate efflux transporter [Stellaceae bacterium]|jgi:chromate transporter|nr:chromate efflux transporter [Stellaceae bacterium]
MTIAAPTAKTESRQGGSALEVLRAFLRLGVTSFGGPVAHLGYFRAEFVQRRQWLDEAVYADIVALCQFLPGPASSQVGISIGILRAGLPGALMAWLGFTMPSAVAMILFGYGVTRFGDLSGAAWLHGLKIVAVAVVAQAVWGMARSLCPDRERATIAVGAAILALAIPSAAGQVGAIAAGGLIGWSLLGGGAAAAPPGPPLAVYLPRALSLAAIAAFFVLLIGLPLLAAAFPLQPLKLFDSFYRSGSLVFGGGHVVLPLLQAEVVPTGWVSNDAFLAGYGAAQAVPGPLFTFSAYLGTVMGPAPNGWIGGLICLAAIFLPSFLLLIGALPFWDSLRRRPAVQSALRGVNAAVVGLLLAALYRPVWTSAIFTPADFAIGIVAFLLLTLWAVPPWLVVILGALAASTVALIAPV